VNKSLKENILSTFSAQTAMLLSKKNNLNELDREHLLTLLEYFRSKLGKKVDRLKEMRHQLNNARSRIDKLKATVEYQRAIILELMERDTAGNGDSTRSERMQRG
jgi:uncharacterized membrane protein YvbJ